MPCCGDHSQIAIGRLEHFIYWSRAFDTLRDLTTTHLIWYWNGTLLLSVWYDVTGAIDIHTQPSVFINLVIVLMNLMQCTSTRKKTQCLWASIIHLIQFVYFPGHWFSIKMLSYKYRNMKSHCGDKTILRPSYLHNGIPYTGKMASLYWIRALELMLTHMTFVCHCPTPIILSVKLAIGWVTK